MTRNPLDLWNSGFVRRWHTNQHLSDTNDFNSGHQWRVMMLVLATHPDPSRELLIACATHDVGEWKTGDLAYPVKRENPQLNRDLEAMEERARDEILGRKLVLTGLEKLWLEWADRTDSYLWMIKHAPGCAQEPAWTQLIRNTDLLGENLLAGRFDEDGNDLAA